MPVEIYDSLKHGASGRCRDRYSPYVFRDIFPNTEFCQILNELITNTYTDNQIIIINTRCSVINNNDTQIDDAPIETCLLTVVSKIESFRFSKILLKNYL